MVTCNRCKSTVNGHTMSMFNTETICLPCARIEEQHPKYDDARLADLNEIRKGNFNFEGIGKPEDLESASFRAYRYGG
jgi:hypothetical protein